MITVLILAGEVVIVWLLRQAFESVRARRELLFALDTRRRVLLGVRGQGCLI